MKRKKFWQFTSAVPELFGHGYTPAGRPDATTQLKSRKEFYFRLSTGPFCHDQGFSESGIREFVKIKVRSSAVQRIVPTPLATTPWVIPAVPFEFRSQDYSRDTWRHSHRLKGKETDISKRNKKSEWKVEKWNRNRKFTMKCWETGVRWEYSPSCK